MTTNMTIGDLKRILDEIPAEDDNCPVVLVSQPGYPFIYDLKASIHSSDEVLELGFEAEQADEYSEARYTDPDEYIKNEKPELFSEIQYGWKNDDDDEKPQRIYYLVEGRQIRYAIGGESLLFNE